jgi:hypothetical protein
MLQARTFDMIQKSVRNQDLISFFRGLANNPKAINALRGFFEANYDSVRSVSVSLCFSLIFYDRMVDKHTPRDDIFNEVHRPGGCLCLSPPFY